MDSIILYQWHSNLFRGGVAQVMCVCREHIVASGACPSQEIIFKLHAEGLFLKSFLEQKCHIFCIPWQVEFWRLLDYMSTQLSTHSSLQVLI